MYLERAGACTVGVMAQKMAVRASAGRGPPQTLWVRTRCRGYGQRRAVELGVQVTHTHTSYVCFLPRYAAAGCGGFGKTSGEERAVGLDRRQECRASNRARRCVPLGRSLVSPDRVPVVNP